MMMLSSFFLATSISLAAAAPPADKVTVWWHTKGGNVTERHDSNGKPVCTLWLLDKTASAAFEWLPGQPVKVTVLAPHLTITRGSQLPVTMQIGDQPPGRPIQATGFANAFSFSLGEIEQRLLPVRLRAADQIELMSPMGDTVIHLPHGKMPALIDHTNECRSKAGNAY